MTKRSRGEVGQSRRRSILAPPIGCHLVRRIATPSVNNGPPSSLSLSLSSPSHFISCPFVRFLIAGQRAAAASPHPSLPSDSIQLGRSSRLCNPTDLRATRVGRRILFLFFNFVSILVSFFLCSLLFVTLVETMCVEIRYSRPVCLTTLGRLFATRDKLGIISRAKERKLFVVLLERESSFDRNEKRNFEKKERKRRGRRIAYSSFSFFSLVSILSIYRNIVTSKR